MGSRTALADTHLAQGPAHVWANEAMSNSAWARLWRTGKSKPFTEVAKTTDQAVIGRFRRPTVFDPLGAWKALSGQLHTSKSGQIVLNSYSNLATRKTHLAGTVLPEPAGQILNLVRTPGVMTGISGGLYHAGRYFNSVVTQIPQSD